MKNLVAGLFAAPPHCGVAPAAALYTASKAAVQSLSRTLAAELTDRRIRVN
uniref:SDR family oxidoreductase n=1 Tax=Nocardia cyriacigeorgica TaxID=135487 RepID=UPI003D78B196